jgi:hypothetical protein
MSRAAVNNYDYSYWRDRSPPVPAVNYACGTTQLRTMKTLRPAAADLTDMRRRQSCGRLLNRDRRCCRPRKRLPSGCGC